MKLTLSWLLDYLNTNADLEEITDKLTQIGLEVEDVIDNSALAGFLVVEVVEVIQHANADKLKLCKVNNGREILQIVCGARNVRKNLKTVIASIGSTLPKSDFTIKLAKIRGIESEGMLCSASELGLSDENSDGIIELSDNYAIGDKFFNCDTIIDINVTPNRGDCLSIYGIARDLAATGIGTLKNFSISRINSAEYSPIDIKVLDQESFISSRYIANVKNIESPKWLKDRLEAIGIRSISALVDITNYIMISFGRTMHVYDADKINGKLEMRKAHFEELFVSLNSKEYLLDNSVNVISDDKIIHSIAGIVGSKHSECTLETINILLESAWFNPISIAKSSRKLNLSTDSSYRFERSVDTGFIIDGLEIATSMIVEICGGKVHDIVCSGSINKTNHLINFDYRDVKKIGSVEILPDEIFSILIKLGFKVEKKQEYSWHVFVPSWRQDITLVVNLVEEVIRIYGYEKVKEELVTNDTVPITSIHDDIRVLMSSRGYHEVITWSFMSSSVAEKFGQINTFFTIDNPFNLHFNLMRPGILPNLLQVATDNIVKGISDFAVFEIGPIYNSEEILDQPQYSLSGIRVGNNLSRNHYNTIREVDMFDVKADLLSVLRHLNVNCDTLALRRTNIQYYHLGKSGTLSFRNRIIGHFGELHPNIIDYFKLKQKVLCFEIILTNIDSLPRNKEKFIDYKYQNVKRDFSFLIDKKVMLGNVISMIKKNSELIREVEIFDIYHGSDIEIGKMSIALSVTFCSPLHTLTQDEIQTECKAVIDIVYKNTGGVLRFALT
ncbi:MAG: phenylalanine--tRNA ligase subunit beta [Wolbachia endosymbiont of Fragariocoptes setiger]|nr:phenylalanine--tRNA ligase subunit beta [Wolbachia endosymbiont of Fragariocoptes setiger]